MSTYNRPSSLLRDSLCPGACQFCRACVERFDPVDEEDDIRSTGTMCHEVMARTLSYATHDTSINHPRELMLPLKDASDFATQLCDRNYRKLNAYDRWAIADALCFAYKMIESNGVRCCYIGIERPLIGEEFGLPHGGTADLLLIKPHARAIVVDWKFGYRDQGQATDNLQLRGYGLMAARQMQVPEADVWIYQPRAPRDRRRSGARYDALALDDAEQQIREICEKSQAADAELIPGHEQCYYCDGLIHCPAARDYIMQARLAIEALPDTSTPELRTELAKARALAHRFDEQAKKYLRAELDRGEEIPGFALRSTGNVTSVELVAEAYRVAHANGIAEEFLAACKPRVEKLRETIGPDSLHAIFGDFIKKKPKRPALVAVKGVA